MCVLCHFRLRFFQDKTTQILKYVSTLAFDFLILDLVIKLQKKSKPPSTIRDARAKTPPNYVELYYALQPLLHKVA
jgi:hypothetical protein